SKHSLFTLVLHSIFLFPGARDLRTLHSFPTRRSSDLPAAAATGCMSLRNWKRSDSMPSNVLNSMPMEKPVQPTWHRQRASCGDRSEEHTSELQSQSNLVCRLLLEKKKKKA